MWRYLLKPQGSVLGKALCVALPSSFLALALVLLEVPLKGVREIFGIVHGTTILWAVVSGPLIILVGFRTSQAWGRFWEGTSLLHAMRGEWFDSASCLVTFTFGAKDVKPAEVREFRHTLVRLMSLCHGSALDELKLDQSECYEVLDIRGLDDETLHMLTHAKDQGFNRVEVLLHLIQVLVINALNKKVIDVPPPILSRVYQTLSRGFVNLLNAKKIKDTRFPFPHAQAIAVMILILSVLTPLVITSLMQEAVLATLGTFVPMLGLCILNYAAEELEMPFGDDANDLPMSHFQQEMNSSLLMLIHGCSDHVPGLKAKAHTDFASLQNSLTDTRNSLNDVLNGKKRKKSLFVQAIAPTQEFEVADQDQESNHSQWSHELPSAGGDVGQPESVEAAPVFAGPLTAKKPEPPDDLSEAASSKAASSKATSSGRSQKEGNVRGALKDSAQAVNPYMTRAQQDEEAQKRVRQQEEKISSSSGPSAGTASGLGGIAGYASNRNPQQLTTGDRVNALLQGISPRLGWQSVSCSTGAPSSPQQQQQQQWSEGVSEQPPRQQAKGQSDVLAGPRHEVGFLTCEV